MKTKMYFILIVVVFILVTGFLVSGLLVQAKNKKISSTDDITNRRAFMEGVFFVQKEINDMRLESLLLAQRKEKYILIGVESIDVLVEEIQPIAEKYGLTKQLIKTDVELSLRSHGIRMGTDIQHQYKKSDEHTTIDIEKSSLLNYNQTNNSKYDNDFLQYAREMIRHDLFRTSRPTTLYINITMIVFEESQRAVFSIRVELKEEAYLCRNAAFCSAPIWYTSGVYACPLSRLKDFVRESLSDDVNEFINDYLAANPKDSFSEEKQ